MNTPNPLIPQGSLLEQQKKGKSNLFIAVFTILAIHVVLFAGLLMQGCNKKPTETTLDTQAAPQPDTNAMAPAPTLPGAGAAPATLPFETNLPQTATTMSNPPAPMAPATIETPVAPPVAGKEYTVAKGDAYYKIAKAHGVSVSALASANPNVDSRKLKVGQKLIIPAAETNAAKPAPAAGKAAPAPTEAAAAKETKAGAAYTVKAGDTLAKIARSHGTTIKAIRTANALKSDQLHPGQKLKLPAGKTPAPADANATGTTAAAKI